MKNDVIFFNKIRYYWYLMIINEYYCGNIDIIIRIVVFFFVKYVLSMLLNLSFVIWLGMLFYMVFNFMILKD